MKSKTHVPGERLYRALLSLYPKHFRERYKSEMLQVFRDLRSKRQVSPLSFWGHLFTDFLMSLSREHIRNIVAPNPHSQDMKLKSSIFVFSLILGSALSVSLFYIAMKPKPATARTLVRLNLSDRSSKTQPSLSALLKTETLEEVARRLDLRQRWQRDAGSPLTSLETTKRLRESIAVKPLRMTNMASIEAHAIETTLAQRIIEELLAIVEESNPSEAPNWSIVQSIAIGPIASPSPFRILTTGSLAGVLIGGLAILGLKRYDIQFSCHRRANLS